MTKHETTRVQHEVTRAKHEYNNIKFILVYLYHRCILGTWYIKSSVYILKLKNWKSLFPVKAKIELENLKASVFVFLFIEIILIASLFRFKTSYEKAFK